MIIRCIADSFLSLYAQPVSRQVKGTIAAISAFGIWGLLPLYWNQLAHVNSFEAIAHRVWWSFLLVWIAVALRRRQGAGKRLFSDRKTVTWAACASVLVAFNWFIYVWAVSQGRTLDASLGYYINPLVNVALGTLVLRERLHKLQWIALFLAVAGVTYLTVQLGVFPWISIGLALSFGIYGLIKKQIPANSTDSLTIELTFIVPVALGIIVWREAGNGGQFLAGGTVTTLLLITAGVITVVPLLLFGYATRSIKLSDVGFIQYIAPTLMLLIGVMVFNEPFDLKRIPGFILVWLGLVVYSINTVRSITANR